jgi:hypothetical protein
VTALLAADWLVEPLRERSNDSWIEEVELRVGKSFTLARGRQAGSQVATNVSTRISK